MSLADAVWLLLIGAATVYLLYRSLWKKRGHCHGCGGSCDTKKHP
jgi:hypothetical protein